MIEASLRTFFVDHIDQWKAVADFLLNQATKRPLSVAEVGNYSADPEQSEQRITEAIKAGQAEELVRYNAVVIYQDRIVISLVLTVELTAFHLSMAEVVPHAMALRRLPEAVAQEAVEQLLGPCEEFHEGPLDQVRHFRRAYH